MVSKHNSTVSIIVPSCDAYSDLWPVWIASQQAAWPDCPYPIYLMSNQVEFASSSVENVRIGVDQSWSTNLKSMLGKVSSEYVIVWLEDLFASSRVDNQKIDKLIEWMRLNDAKYLRLGPLLPHHSLLRGDVYEVLPEETARTSVVTSIWRKDVLMQLLRDGESAWAFEREGSARSAHEFPTGFYATRKWHTPIINGVWRGVWSPASVQELLKRKLSPDLSSRRQMTPAEYAKHVIKGIIYNALMWCWVFRPNSRRRSSHEVF